MLTRFMPLRVGRTSVEDWGNILCQNVLQICVTVGQEQTVVASRRDSAGIVDEIQPVNQYFPDNKSGSG